jgi:hypothetical protein
MTSLLLLACWIDVASASQGFARVEQAIHLPAVAVAVAVAAEPAVELTAAPDKQAGAISIAIYASTRVARLRAGGDGSRKHPFYFEFPIAFYVRIRISIVLAQNQPIPDEPKKPPQAGGGTPAPKS